MSKNSESATNAENELKCPNGVRNLMAVLKHNESVRKQLMRVGFQSATQ
jgi:hypothetical protein